MQFAQGRPARNLRSPGVKQNGSHCSQDIPDPRALDRSAAHSRAGRVNLPAQTGFAATASSIMLSSRAKREESARQQEALLQKPGFLDSKKIRSFIAKLKKNQDSSALTDRPTHNLTHHDASLQAHLAAARPQQPKARSASKKKSEKQSFHETHVGAGEEPERPKYFAKSHISNKRSLSQKLHGRDFSASQSVRGLREGVHHSREFLQNVDECIQHLQSNSQNLANRSRASGQEPLQKAARGPSSAAEEQPDLKTENEVLRQKVSRLKVKLREETVCKEYWREKFEDLQARYNELLLLNVKAKEKKKSLEERETKPSTITTRSTLESSFKPAYKK